MRKLAKTKGRRYYFRMKERAKRIGEQIRRQIHEVDPTAQVILYGSRARGEEHPDSDWDILVLTKYPVGVSEERVFRDHLYEMELTVEEPFSLFVYSLKQWEENQRITPFYQSVKKEGVFL